MSYSVGPSSTENHLKCFSRLARGYVLREEGGVSIPPVRVHTAHPVTTDHLQLVAHGLSGALCFSCSLRRPLGGRRRHHEGHGATNCLGSFCAAGPSPLPG